MALKKTEKDAATEAAATPAPEASAPAAETVTTGAGNIVASSGTKTTSQPAEPDVNAVAPTQTEKTPSVIEKDQVSAEEQAAHDNAQLQAEAEAKGQDPKKVKVLVEVENLKSMAQRQPSTGTWIEPKSTAHVLDDYWLENQVKAGILKRV